MNDDWSYIFTARRLAETGHIVYNGWSTAMLGWQLFLGAAFVKAFGFSYTVVRVPVFLVSLATAALLQRTLRRMGVGEWNATIGTLAFVLSPLFLPLAFSFMTDVPGLFAILVCLYGCVRATQAIRDREALLWLIFAALSNILGGTVRQIAWLGVLVLVPVTAVVIRRRRGALVLGGVLWGLGGVSIVFALRWFLRQPYALPEKLLTEPLGFSAFRTMLTLLVEIGMAALFFAFPILLGFAIRFPFRRRAFSGALAVLVALLLLWGGRHLYRHDLDPWWLAPQLPNIFTARGMLDIREIEGVRPELIGVNARVVLTALSLIAAFCFGVTLFASQRESEDRTAESQPLPWSTLLALTIPFTAAYILLLIPRGIHTGIYDRYLLPILAVLLGPVLRVYQERVSARLPVACGGLVIAVALFSTALLHDVFALDRARLKAIEELRTAGIERQHIRGGVDYDAWTQIETRGYINEPRIVLPAGSYVAAKRSWRLGNCPYYFSELTPAVNPMFALSYDPTICGGLSAFEPVRLRTWLPLGERTIYIVETR